MLATLQLKWYCELLLVPAHTFHEIAVHNVTVNTNISHPWENLNVGTVSQQKKMCIGQTKKQECICYLKHAHQLSLSKSVDQTSYPLLEPLIRCFLFLNWDFHLMDNWVISHFSGRGASIEHVTHPRTRNEPGSEMMRYLQGILCFPLTLLLLRKLLQGLTFTKMVLKGKQDNTWAPEARKSTCFVPHYNFPL